MDKIQAAIAKARAARNALGGEAPDIPLPTPTAKVPLRRPDAISRILAPKPPSPKIARTLAWQPLATFAPNAKQMERNRIVTFSTSGKKASGAIAYDMLRTKVLQEMRANGWRRLAITSPGPKCGKTTTALNLAFSLSKQPETHTIVAEMDMRRPSLAKTLSISGDTSFSTVIEGKADFADMAMRPRPNLAFAVNHTRARNPSELLQSSTIGKVLSKIEEQFDPDLTIFDMPPMLVSDDTMAFMGQVDCVLLVAAAESTSLGEIDICERDLAAQTNVLGVMLNKCRYMDKDSGKGRYD